MAIKGVDEVIKNMEAFTKRVDQQIKRVNEYVGETFVADARGIDTYRDRTANLRNANGYMVVSPEGDTENANASAKEAISEVRNEVSEQGLILVNGMEYAGAVESRGYDVITNSANKAKRNYMKLMKQALKV